MDHPKEYTVLNERLAELSDLGNIASLMHWDQQTMMPSAGGEARADQFATITKIHHELSTHPEMGRLLDALSSWEQNLDPESDEARTLYWVRRDFEKSKRVPVELAQKIAHAEASGRESWEQALNANDFSLFRDALARNIELAHRYVECFDDFDHPYEALLDDYEPGIKLPQIRALFDALSEELIPLVAAAGDKDQARNDGLFSGPYDVALQRKALDPVLQAVGFDDNSWRLDTTLHPFEANTSFNDIRLTTHYSEADFGVTFYSVLHEFGHGLYDHQIHPRFHRTALGSGVSLGIHESQSRMWENMIGRSRPFCEWVLPILKQELGGPLVNANVDDLYRGVNTVQPSLIRIYADETTYNLHVILRFNLEVALFEGRLTVDELPDAWNSEMERLLGVTVPNDASGVLQDVHWSGGSFGYFPTYTLGNIIAGQLWEVMHKQLPTMDEQIARGEFGDIREWLRTNIHQHGRKFRPLELVERIAGDGLDHQPLARYLDERLVDAGVVSESVRI